MGKIKRTRQKFHAAALKGPNTAPNELIEPVPEIRDIADSNLPKRNLFEGINIDLRSLNQNVAEFDTRSILSSKSLGFQLKKKEKRKIRHEIFLKKLDIISTAQKEAAKTKKLKQTPVVGDLRPLEDALPTLELLMRESTDAKNEAEKQAEKPRSSISFHARQKATLTEIDMFKKIASNEVFKSNPTGTILAHLRYKAERGQL